jgi:Enolase, C-terminal TIM barrel domain
MLPPCVPHSLSTRCSQLGEMYKDLCAQYPIVSIEDPFDQVSKCTYCTTLLFYMIHNEIMHIRCLCT